MIKRLITALATPFEGGKIDEKSFARLVEYQVSGGADALLALGTTAESQMLTKTESNRLLTLCKITAGNVPIIAGVHESATDKACDEAKRLQDLGASALLIAPPSFCKCTPVGYKAHIEAICRAVKLPVILYNAPSRAGYCLDTQTVLALADKIAAVKDACDGTEFAKKAVTRVPVLCGSDERIAEYLEAGARGVISVTSNAAPLWTGQILGGERSEEFTRFARLTMTEINPIAIKYFLYRAGIFRSYETRLPLSPASSQTREAIDGFLQEHGDKIR